MSGNSNTNRPSCRYSTCLTTFANTKAMRKHMEESHKPRKICPFEGCSTPSYQTRRRSRLMKHFRDAHGLSKSDAKEWGNYVERNTPYFDDQGQQGDTQGMTGSTDNADNPQNIQVSYMNSHRDFSGAGSSNGPWNVNGLLAQDTPNLSRVPVLRSYTGAEIMLEGPSNEDDGDWSPEETAEEAAEYDDEGEEEEEEEEES